MQGSATSAAVIEAAITPLRFGAPVQTVDDMVREALACISAGAGIVHHHHDMRLEEGEATWQMTETGRRILERHPGTLIYTDYLRGKRAEEENAHLRPMHEAGVLTMFAIDPGITAFPNFNAEGRPVGTYTDGLRFSEADMMIGFSKEMNVPISLGVFEPGQLRWIAYYGRHYGFSPGTMIKLYFGGGHLVDRPDAQGINFGLPPTTAALDVYLSMMEGLDMPWTVSLFGDPLLDSPLARYALEKGGHLRVGVEDAAIETGMTNADMVAAAVALAHDVGRPTATGADALATLRGQAVAVAG